MSLTAVPKVVVKISTLEKMAMEYAENNVPLSEIKGQDITGLLFAVLESMLTMGELINIAIVGFQTRGKSALACYLMDWINKRINVVTTIDHIAGDEIEFTRKVINKDAQNMAMVIDEINRLNEVGYNASTEKSLKTYYDEVCAQRFVHRVQCSPIGIGDATAQIVLTVMGKEESTKSTIAEVHYRVIRAGESYLQYVGRVKICIAETLGKPWYKEYRKKKFAKMALVHTVGVKDVRELEWSDVVWAAYQELEPLTEVATVKKDVQLNVLGRKRRELKQFHSIVMDMKLYEMLNGLLSQKREVELWKFRESKAIELNMRKPSPENAKAIKKIREIKTKMQEILTKMINEEKAKMAAMEEYYGSRKQGEREGNAKAPD